MYVGRTAHVAVQPDGKILFGGDISDERSGVIRLNADGSKDATFNQGVIYAFSFLSAMTVQPDGKVLLAGNAIVRLLPNGEPDPNFLHASLDWSDGWPYYIPIRLALQSDGKIVVSGAFTEVHGMQRAGLARLNTNGSVDTAFNVASNDLPQKIDALALQTDGKILIAGYSLDSGLWQGHFVRLWPDGTRDTNFVAEVGGGVSVIALQSDGRILAAGYHWENYQQHGYIVRLNADGSKDPTFGGTPGRVGVNGYGDEGVSSMIVQGDGKILVGGSFFDSENADSGSLMRLNADGALDVDFQLRLSLSRWADDIESVSSMALQANGAVLIAGDFAMVDGVERPGIARVFAGNDDCQVISFFAENNFGQEGLTNATVMVQREGANLGPLTIRYIVRVPRDETGSYFLDGIRTGSAEDLTALQGEITLAEGETNTSFAVPIFNDTLIEPTETFQIVLTGTTGPAAFGNRTRASLHIFDDDSLGLPGALDSTFSAQLSGTVKALVTQPDGKLIVGGRFSFIIAIRANNLLRLNADGTLDVDFDLGVDVPAVAAIVLQADGKIIVGGEGLMRLESNGAIDASFPAASQAVDALAIQADGRILVGGTNGLQRLHTNGMADSSFVAFDGMAATSHVSHVRALAVQSDGKIIVGGENALSELPVLVRLNTDGTRDSAFDGTGFQMGYHGGFELGVLSVLLQPDGKIVVGGGFRYDVPNHPGAGMPFITRAWNLVRLNSDGTHDSSFEGSNPVNTYIKAIARQPDAKLLVSGYFWSLGQTSDGGVGLERLFEDGGTDHSFFTGVGALAAIDAIAVQPNGSIWIGGTFTKYNGYPQAALARLHGDDQPGPGRIEFVQSYGSVKENTGHAVLKLRRYWGKDGEVSVSYATFDGTASSGVHYMRQTGTVVFASGELEKTITVPLLDDLTPELNRHFTVHLSHPTAGVLLGLFNRRWVNIVENDRGILARRTERVPAGPGSGHYLFFSENFTAHEEVGSIRIELFYVGDPTDGAIGLDLATVDGSARAGSDYSAQTRTTQFGGPYSTQQEIEIPILSDSIAEGPETFTLTLRNVPPDIALVRSNIVVTIVDYHPEFRLQPHPVTPTPNGRFRMLLHVPRGRHFLLETSTNLIDWASHTSFPAQNSTQPIEFEDADAVNFNQRFYRIVAAEP